MNLVRWAARARGAVGAIDVRRARALVERRLGWVQRRFPLVERLAARSRIERDEHGDAAAAVVPLAAGWPAEPSTASAAAPRLAHASEAGRVVAAPSEAGPAALLRLRRPPVQASAAPPSEPAGRAAPAVAMQLPPAAETGGAASSGVPAERSGLTAAALAARERPRPPTPIARVPSQAAASSGSSAAAGSAGDPAATMLVRPTRRAWAAPLPPPGRPLDGTTGRPPAAAAPSATPARDQRHAVTSTAAALATAGTATPGLGAATADRTAGVAPTMPPSQPGAVTGPIVARRVPPLRLPWPSPLPSSSPSPLSSPLLSSLSSPLPLPLPLPLPSPRAARPSRAASALPTIRPLAPQLPLQARLPELPSGSAQALASGVAAPAARPRFGVVTPAIAAPRQAAPAPAATLSAPAADAAAPAAVLPAEPPRLRLHPRDWERLVERVARTLAQRYAAELERRGMPRWR